MTLFWLLEHIPMLLVHLVIFAGIIAFLVARFTPLIPDKLLIKIVGILVFCFGILLEGLTLGVGLIKPDLAKAQAEVVAINKKAAEITAQVQTVYVDRVKVIKEKGDETVRYVSTNNDSDCKLYNSTVMLLDAASKNEVPSAASRTDDTTSTVRLSDEERVIAGNYEKYNLVAQELISLQNWVKQQQTNNADSGK